MLGVASMFGSLLMLGVVVAVGALTIVRPPGVRVLPWGGRLRWIAPRVINQAWEAEGRLHPDRERPVPSSGGSIRAWAALGIAMVALAPATWIALRFPAVAVVAGIFGLTSIGVAVPAWRQHVYLDRDGASAGRALIARADRARAAASERARRGDQAGARSTLRDAVQELRAGAPGSGQPAAVLAKAAELEAAVRALPGEWTSPAWPSS